MDIVPDDDPLVIEAWVNPNDIDVVVADLPAKVRLTSFSHLTMPLLSGKVLQVSADSIIHERTGTALYEARVELDPEQPELAGLKLQPGMPAEVMIVTGKRTPLDYLLKPIVTSFGRALREE
jgi:multidrug efflux pump subunit AcrA (membrane-fusion protein)